MEKETPFIKIDGKKWWTDRIGESERSYRKDYKFISGVYTVSKNRKDKNSTALLKMTNVILIILNLR